MYKKYISPSELQNSPMRFLRSFEHIHSRQTLATSLFVCVDAEERLSDIIHITLQFRSRNSLFERRQIIFTPSTGPQLHHHPHWFDRTEFWMEFWQWDPQMTSIFDDLLNDALIVLEIFTFSKNFHHLPHHDFLPAL